MIYCDLIEQKIQLDDFHRRLEHPGHGAQIVFLGTIRNQNLGRKVTAVAYDAFVPLARKILYEICDEAREKWGESLQAVVIHRIGKLHIGETSVAIGISLPHRGEAYQASRYLIDELKHRAPIWKKEYYEDGESQWLEGHALCQATHH